VLVPLAMLAVVPAACSSNSSAGASSGAIFDRRDIDS
jgi:hypothetical protein